MVFVPQCCLLSGETMKNKKLLREKKRMDEKKKVGWDTDSRGRKGMGDEGRN